MFKLLLGDPNARKLKRYKPLVDEINGLEGEVAALTDQELQGRTHAFRERFAGVHQPDRRLEVMDELLPEAFALVREAGKRVLDMRHFDVQLIGGMVLHDGQIAEMKTGEGKTLVATLPAYLNALAGQGVHIVTVNDYLARRDTEWVGQIHRFLGLSVGLIQQEMSPEERQRNYACDITYVTNSELGFDYLRDNMATDLKDLVQRDFHYCIIDEVDSILVDEARTPLIISGQVERPQEKYKEAASIAAQLLRAEGMTKDGVEPEGDYEVDEKQRNVMLTDQGFEKVEKLLQIKDLFNPKDPWAHYINNALKAKELFIKDVNYIVREGQAVIVDEFTGRVMPTRRWSDGQHQAIEAKEGLEIQAETQTMATITYQNLFLLYPRLAGMTGTAKTEETELEKTYNLEVTVVPTNRPLIRKDWPDQVFKTEDAKWRAVADEIAREHEMGRPVLVGTTSVEKSELISGLLGERSIPHNLLNAKPENVEREAEIIAQAGRAGAVTISTNMAGRGTDIILGGNTDYMARLRIREALLPRLVNPEDPQLMGGALGRQRLNPVQAEALLRQRQQEQFRRLAKLFPCPLSREAEEELKQLGADLEQAWGERRLSLVTLDERLNVAAEKAPIQDELIQRLRELMQKIRAEYDGVTDREQEDVTNRGGLHVIGTERHESRRVDNQLRGRSGRQGDPGSSRFFLSLEDSLLRIFGGDRVAKVMDAFRVEEDMPIESGLLTRSLESAQKKVETYYFDIRKQVFDYDQVMNNQRRAIYAERRRVLKGDQLKQQVLSYGERTMEDIVDAYVDPELPPEEWSLDRLAGKVKEFVYLLSDLQPQDLSGLKVEELKAFLCEQLRSAYDIKEAQVNEIQSNLMRQAERFFILQQIDTLWREHLQSMDALRESVNLRGYGQKDPLMEYKNEGYTMFLEMMTQMRRNVIYSMFMFEPRPPAVSTPSSREVIV
ncbi:MAG: preprotein translocase subunit SecA [Synechococcus sp. SB0673_bin_10]|nr:preprotein translocase subunit SecA [Synechococcus sp. SB0667_bin_8]MYG64148.1 preprotein translocase subunit SecA [Synechococcus sp. SB0675_bin_7]MYI71850.1 preprotein translocase subunit SecA [Synechococcus sp. SB0673_bin_10]MYK85871.1 preprotein translocase subunit SecA [Synechococcus sp. SB0669_bin_7]